jgi:hypothetical protein
LFNDPSPDTVPASVVVTVTLSVDALNVVTVFPQLSSAVSVFVPVNATPLVCGLVRLHTNFPNPSADTATVKRSDPVELIVPSVTEIVAVSAR